MEPVLGGGRREQCVPQLIGSAAEVLEFALAPLSPVLHS
jgi:hypothetical protein